MFFVPECIETNVFAAKFRIPDTEVNFRVVKVNIRVNAYIPYNRDIKPSHHSLTLF